MEHSKVRLDQFDPTLGYFRKVSKLKEVLWYLIKMVFFLSAFPFPSSFKRALLLLFGAKIGKNLTLKPRVNIHMPWNLTLGDNVWIGEEVFILNFERFSAGNNVCLSQRAFLCGGNHNYMIPSMPYRNGEIELEDGVWIGASCFVAPETRVGVDTVVTACSIISGRIPANAIFGGNPAVFIKKRWKNDNI